MRKKKTPAENLYHRIQEIEFLVMDAEGIMNKARINLKLLRMDIQDAEKRNNQSIEKGKS